MHKHLVLILLFVSSFCFGSNLNLTLIPPTTITNQVDLDIRVGILNNSTEKKNIEIHVFLNNETSNGLIYKSMISIGAGKSQEIKLSLPTEDKVGKNKIIAVVKDGVKVVRESKAIEIISSEIRSTRTIDGAWLGIYHWSETEGKNWNKDISILTDNQWGEMISSMHKIGMDIVVIQEVFRNQYYVGKHEQSIKNYDGKAFYPSKLYPARMPIAAKDPIEAILSEADKLGMHVFMGVGMFAWFDFTEESLEWHKIIAKELWEMYGHHKSFYGFYVSEESGGGLDNGEKTETLRSKRKSDIVDFFRVFKQHCNTFAPGKPVMLATNSMKVPNALDTYPKLLQYLDILCPFGFARMPKNDLTGKEAADLLQKLVDNEGSHLWFDLEAFLFNEDKSLYPRPMEDILKDLNIFENFEKILCYQYPGVFSDPSSDFRVGEKRTVTLFNDYKKYLKKSINNKND